MVQADRRHTGLSQRKAAGWGTESPHPRSPRRAPTGRLLLTDKIEDGCGGRAASNSAIAADSPSGNAHLSAAGPGQPIHPAVRANPSSTKQPGRLVPVLKRHTSVAPSFLSPSDGGAEVEHNINRDPAKPGFESRDRRAGRAIELTLTGRAEKAWISFVPTEQDGRPRPKRIVDKPSPDRTSIKQTEASDSTRPRTAVDEPSLDVHPQPAP